MDDETADCPPSPRRRDREATAAALLDSAKAVFSERGFDAATTREIAAGAGVNEQLIQRYFGGKSGLLLAVVDRYGREEGQGCHLPPPGDDLEGEILRFLEAQVEHTWKCRDISKVVLDRALVDPEVAEHMGRTLTEARVPCLLDRLETLRARGLIDADADLPNVAAGLASFSFALGFMDRVVFARDPGRLCAIVRSLAQTVARGLSPQSRS
ncbi:TetR/AcrR family transcriptional regulator [Azospirillum halopraeferens]|uniref:TetR/AcrR family transcriptional regulator n=1 Tax=Azospirillum halopraeferens TaxID=34010 RepID=UPI0004182A58|nr:TetR/AcrR family transcriptional regulator [Azospirillum halopraeferens]